MRILLVVPEWPPNVIGGGGQVYERIARYLAAAGHSVTVVHGEHTNRALFARATAGRQNNLNVVSIPLIPTPRAAASLATALPPVPSSIATLNNYLSMKWDVAHLHGAGFPMIDYSAWMLRRRGVPYVFTIHGVPVSPLRRSRLTAAVLRFYMSQVTRATVDRAAAVTAVSASMLQTDLLPVQRGIVIYNGIDVPSEGDAQRHVVPHAPLRLVSMSRLSHNKGIDVALRAVASLRDEGVAVKYSVYGTDGGDAAALQRLSQHLRLDNHVDFCGAFSPSEREEILATADMCLLPSRNEAFGLVALEVLAAGLPIVASRADGLAEILDETSAMVVPDFEPASWARAIQRAADPHWRSGAIKHGLDILERFDWQHKLAEYESVLMRVSRTMGDR